MQLPPKAGTLACDFDFCDKRSYCCEICGKAFTKHSALRSHNVEHTNVKPFPCEVVGCDKSFLTRSKLERHGKVHNYGYICVRDDCHASFCKWSELMKHTKAEHNTRFQCAICKKGFALLKVYKQHLTTHENNRTLHACTVEGCDRTYMSASSLRQHINCSHSEMKTCVCDHSGCNRSFAWKSSLNKHIEREHRQGGLSPHQQRLAAGELGNLAKIRESLVLKPAKVRSGVVKKSTEAEDTTSQQHPYSITRKLARAFIPGESCASSVTPQM
eukprot:CFRG1308T1